MFVGLQSPLSIVTNIINHSYWSYVHQLSYHLGGPRCIIVLRCLVIPVLYPTGWGAPVIYVCWFINPMNSIVWYLHICTINNRNQPLFIGTWTQTRLVAPSCSGIWNMLIAFWRLARLMFLSLASWFTSGRKGYGCNHGIFIGWYWSNDAKMMRLYIMWLKQFHKPSPSHHHKYIGAMFTIPSQGWFMASFYPHFKCFFIIPTDELIFFQRGRYTTNQYWTGYLNLRKLLTMSLHRFPMCIACLNMGDFLQTYETRDWHGYRFLNVLMFLACMLVLACFGLLWGLGPQW